MTKIPKLKKKQCGKIFTSHFRLFDELLQMCNGKKTKFYAVTRRKDYKRRGIAGDYVEWLPVLSPSRDLLNMTKKNEIDWNQYKEIYLYEMTNEVSEEAIKQLSHEVATGTTIVLLCYEHPKDNCHRKILYNLLLQKTRETMEELYNAMNNGHGNPAGGEIVRRYYRT